MKQKRIGVLLILVILIVFTPMVTFGVYHDGSFSPDPSPSDPPDDPIDPGDSDDSDDSDDSGDDNSGGDSDSGDSGDSGDDGDNDGDGSDDTDGSDNDNSDNSDDSDDSDDSSNHEENLAEIESETERVLQEIESAKERVAAADAALYRRLAAGVASDRVSGGGDIDRAVEAYMEAGRNAYDPVLRADESAWSNRAYQTGTHRSEIAEQLGVTATPHHGDPVRVLDGAYIATLPLPVFRYGTTEIDLSLAYDSSRSVRGEWGIGWTGITEERILQGGVDPPEISSLLSDAHTTVRSSLEGIKASIDTIAPGIDTTEEIAVVTTELLSARVAFERTVAECDSKMNEALLIREQAIADRVSTDAPDRLITDIRALRNEAIDGITTIDNVLPFLEDCDSALEESARSIEELETRIQRLEEAQREWEIVEEINATAAFPGTDPGMTRIGSDHCVYIDRLGRPILFRRGTDALYRSTARPYATLEKHNGSWRLTAAGGETRIFGRDGQIEKIVSPQGRSVSFRRRSTPVEQQTEIVGPDGTVIASYRRSTAGETENELITLSIPTFADHRFEVDQELLRRVESPRGSITLGYNQKALVEINRDDGRTVIDYDAEGRVVAVTYPTGGVESFLYPSENRRIFRDPDGVETVREYRNGKLVRTEESNGHILEQQWEKGKVIIQRDNRGHLQMYTYDDAGAVKTEQFADGSWVTVDRDQNGAPIRLTSDKGLHWETQRDAQGRVVRFSSPERVIDFHRDEDDSSLEIRDSRGGSWVIEYDNLGAPARIERGDGRVEEREFDSLGRLVEYRVNGETIQRIEYEDDGRPALVEEAGRVTEYLYNDDPPRTRSILINGHHHSTTAFDPNGRIVGREFFDGTTERFTYSPGGRVIEYAGRGGATVQYRRNGGGAVTEIAFPELGGSHRFRYDETGRLVEQRFPTDESLRYLYNANGQSIGVQYPDGTRSVEEHLPGGRVRRVTPTGSTVMYRYDSAHRLIRVIDDEGEVRRYTYTPTETQVFAAGEVESTREYDPYRRLTATLYPDGTAERYEYGVGPLPLRRTDRRGGEDRWRWDPIGRCLYHRDPTGAEERWRYETDRSRYTAPSGEVTTIEFDPDGRPVTVQDAEGTRRYRYLEGGVLEITGADGETEKRYFYGSHQIFGLDGDAPFRASRTEPYQSSNLRSFVMNQSGRRYEAEIDWNGSIRSAVLGGGDSELIQAQPISFESEVDPLGFPRRLETGDKTFRMSWTDGGSIRSWQPTSAPPRRYSYDRRGVPTGWSDQLGSTSISVDRTANRTVFQSESSQNSDLPPTATHRRTVTTDPYGLVLGDLHEGFNGDSTEMLYQRDRAGRVTSIRCSESDSTIGVEYGSQKSTTVTLGEYTIDLAAGEGGKVMIGLGAHEIEVEGERVLYDQRYEIVRRGTGSARFTARRRSGLSTTVDAIVSLTDRSGRRSVEHHLDGTLYSYRYDSVGRLAVIRTTQGVHSGTEWIRGERSSAGIATQEELRERWRAIGVPNPPSIPLQLTEYRRSIDSNRSTENEGVPRIVRNARGQIREVGTSQLHYDPISDRLCAVSNHEASWEIIRDSAGRPIVCTDRESGFQYVGLTTDIEVADRVFTVRHWERRSFGNDTGTGDRAPGRYWSGSTEKTGGIDQEAQLGQVPLLNAIEIRIGGVPLAYVEGERLIIPFCDDRGSIRGLYDTNADHQSTAYRPIADPMTFLTMGSPITEGHTLPDAIPYETVVAQGERLRGTDLLLAGVRTVIPSLGEFDRPDPALDGLDWYQYCHGDPVNYVDTTGLFVVPADSDHYQQDPRWAKTKLGTSSVTIGKYGCKLVTLSNAINQIAGETISDPEKLNQILSDGYYVKDSLIDSETAAKIMSEATGHEVVYISFDPDEVDIEAVINRISDDPSTRYVVSAHILVHEKPGTSGENKPYPHFLNVTGFDSENMPLFQDTSRRGRTSLAENEEIVRYDIYAVSDCKVY